MAKKKPTRPLTPTILAGYGAFFVALWLLWNTPFVLPVKLFVVFLHEISHGIAAIATGGRIERIVINADEGGLCICGGGSTFLTLSAGYLGSLLWGLALIGVARLERQARWSTAVAGAGTAVVTLLYVRGLFGFAFGLAAAVTLFLASRRLSSRWNARLLVGLGLTSALYAILDIKSDVIERPGLPSDARMLEELTGVPTIVWGVMWIGVALGVVVLALRSLWNRTVR
jgi:hypothetical protein